MNTELDPLDEEEFLLMSHMLDDTLTRYRQHGVLDFTPLAQAQTIYRNTHLRSLSTDDLVSLIAVMAVRLFETGPQAPTEA